MPQQEKVARIIEEVRICGVNARRTGSDHDHLNKLIAWYSKQVVGLLFTIEVDSASKNRVAHFGPIYRAYLSHCWNCKKCEYDCRSMDKESLSVVFTNQIRGPCKPSDPNKSIKEAFT